MKAKSSKLRMLLTIHTLFKYTDNKHWINTTKLNEYLKPYDLECTRRAFSNTVKALRQYGVDVKDNGKLDSHGFWIENRILGGANLEKLIFAVSTNPYISKEQAFEILNTLKPLVSEFEKEKLLRTPEASPYINTNDKFSNIYSVIYEAIQKNRRVLYSINYMKINKENLTLETKSSQGMLLTPKCVYRSNQRLYMIGYNHKYDKIQAVDFETINEIRLSNKHSYEGAEKTYELLSNAPPSDYVPEEKIIYEGEVTFYCKGHCLEELYSYFGAPINPIKLKPDGRRSKRQYYTVSDVKITPKTILWLLESNGDIILKGSDRALERVREYCDIGTAIITNKKLK